MTHASAVMARRFLLALAAAAMLLPGAESAAGPVDEWPTRAVRIIIPYPPGGSTDLVARPYAQILGEKLGQPFVLEHKAGATGAIGMEATARAAPDGYTFTITAAASAVAMPAIRKLPYRPFDDLVPVGRLATLALAVAVTNEVPTKTFPEFIAYAKANPGKLNYGIAGIGATSHFAGEHLKQLTGIDMTNVPYKGSAEVQADFLAGHVQVMFDGQILPYLKAGKGRLLAYIDQERHPDFPDVPTMKELLPAWQIYIWTGMLAPAGTPRPIIDKLSKALNEIGRQPDMQARLEPLAQRTLQDTPEGYGEQMRKDFALYSRMAKELDIKPE